jgi:hypothetical protein
MGESDARGTRLDLSELPGVELTEVAALLDRVDIEADVAALAREPDQEPLDRLASGARLGDVAVADDLLIGPAPELSDPEPATGAGHPRRLR